MPERLNCSLRQEKLLVLTAGAGNILRIAPALTVPSQRTAKLGILVVHFFSVEGLVCFWLMRLKTEALWFPTHPFPDNFGIRSI